MDLSTVTTHRRLVAWLLGATLIPIGALGGLGVRILAQDRDIERQRRRERLEVAAGRLALDIDRRIQDIEERLARGAGVRFFPTSLQSSRDLPVLYQPEAPLENAAQQGILTAAETWEFQRRDPVAAVAAYERAATSSDRAMRAAALVGL